MDKLYSHYSKQNKKKLYIHLKNVAEKSRNKIRGKDLDLSSIIKKDKLVKISYLIGVAHDFGKATTFFQNYLIHGEKHELSHHGLISALFGYLLVDKHFDDEIFAMIAYMVIKRHHGNLESPLEEPRDILYETQDQLKNIKDNTKDNVKKIYNELLTEVDFEVEELFTELSEIIAKEDELIDKFEEIIWFDDMFEAGENKTIELFLITNLLYSVVIDTDKKDAARVDNSYFDGAEEKEIDIKDYIDDCRRKKPEKFDPSKSINEARNEFFTEVLNNSQLKKNNYLYSLTAPTGIGKTFTSFAFANRVKDFYDQGRRIIYCLPFTSIIDQNHDILEDIIEFNLGDKYRKNPTKYLLRHHYLTPMKLKRDVDLGDDSKESQDLDKYLEEKLLLESWESGNIVTTFVQLLQSIIGNKNSFLKKFHNIVNSIIILDEVQNIPVKYYRIVGKVLEILAKKFNTHILLLTATQPEIIPGNDVISLVDDEKYAKMSVFNRVDLEIIDELKSKDIDEFVNYFDINFNSNNGLVVCNTITAALDVFEKLDHLFADYQIFSLTTYQIPKDRKEKIDKIREKVESGEKVIVVSTQLIEAGVDLSFEEVYRDFGPLDSIIQVAGRCNRNQELAPGKGKVKVVKLEDEKENEYCKRVYDSKLIEICEEVMGEKDHYEAKDFIDLSKDYFTKIRNSYKRDSIQLLKAITELNYSKKIDNQIPIKAFKLIEYQAGKEDIIICKKGQDEAGNVIDVEGKIDELSVLYEELKEVNDDKEKLNSLIGKIELIKKELAKYRISVYSNQLNKYYRDYQIIKEFRFINYVSYDDQKKYLYDEDTGFCREPKSSPQSTLII
ncbi:CRISPR-associated helicase Cas3' [Halanaerobaculum tunisiense]